MGKFDGIVAGGMHSRLQGITYVAPLDTATYTWQIQGLTLAHFTAAKVGKEQLFSPQFEACGFHWKLSAFMGGFDDEQSGSFCPMLTLETPDVILDVDWTMQTSGRDEAPYRASHRFCTHDDDGSNWGPVNFVPHSDIAASPYKYLPRGVLTLTVTITLEDIREAAVPSPISSITVPPPSALSELRALLDSGAGTDVALACGGQSVPAHSLVLRMRSPVFRAQLAPDSPLVAADPSAVPVPEEITPATLRRLLEFIYSDELEPASSEEAGSPSAGTVPRAKPGT